MRISEEAAKYIQNPLLFPDFLKQVSNLFKQRCKNFPNSPCPQGNDCFYTHINPQDPQRGPEEYSRQKWVRDECANIQRIVLSEYQQQAAFQASDKKRFQSIKDRLTKDFHQKGPSALSAFKRTTNQLFKTRCTSSANCPKGQSCPLAHFPPEGLLTASEVIRKEAIKAQYADIRDQVQDKKPITAAATGQEESPLDKAIRENCFSAPNAVLFLGTIEFYKNASTKAT